MRQPMISFLPHFMPRNSSFRRPMGGNISMTGAGQRGRNEYRAVRAYFFGRAQKYPWATVSSSLFSPRPPSPNSSWAGAGGTPWAWAPCGRYSSSWVPVCLRRRPSACRVLHWTGAKMRTRQKSRRWRDALDWTLESTAGHPSSGLPLPCGNWRSREHPLASDRPPTGVEEVGCARWRHCRSEKD
jgi:hypothetical protein